MNQAELKKFATRFNCKRITRKYITVYMEIYYIYRTPLLWPLNETDRTPS